MTPAQYFSKWHPTAPWLTARQAEIVKLMMLGLSNKEIAAKLGIVPSTAETHRANIYEKAYPEHRHWANAMTLTREFWLKFAEDYRKRGGR
jgi:DNA-binding CsgD family transcriptional regulator